MQTVPFLDTVLDTAAPLPAILCKCKSRRVHVPWLDDLLKGIRQRIVQNIICIPQSEYQGHLTAVCAGLLALLASQERPQWCISPHAISLKSNFMRTIRGAMTLLICTISSMKQDKELLLYLSALETKSAGTDIARNLSVPSRLCDEQRSGHVKKMFLIARPNTGSQTLLGHKKSDGCGKQQLCSRESKEGKQRFTRPRRCAKNRTGQVRA